MNGSLSARSNFIISAYSLIIYCYYYYYYYYFCL